MIQRNDLFDERMRKDYFYVVGAVAISIIAEMFSVVFVAPNSFHRFINVLSNVIGFGVSPLIPLLTVGAFSSEHSRLRWPNVLPSLINLLLVMLSPIYGLIFYVSPPRG